MTSLTTTLKAIVKRPNLLYSRKHIILISHMRANTSLLGHLLGNHSEISGYYEMHIGYYSWKSLIRQKIEFFSTHSDQPSTKYLFDKVLHSEHYVEPNVLKGKNVIPIMSLRNPEDTVPSIIKLYSKVNQDHEFFTVPGAIEYYEKRLDTLLDCARAISGDYIYIDAEAIKTNTKATLDFLSDEISLGSPIEPTYKSNVKTGQGDSGDHSENLKKGFVSSAQSDYSYFEWPDGKKEMLINKYNKVREELISRASSVCTK